MSERAPTPKEAQDFYANTLGIEGYGTKDPATVAKKATRRKTHASPYPTAEDAQAAAALAENQKEGYLLTDDDFEQLQEIENGKLREIGYLAMLGIEQDGNETTQSDDEAETTVLPPPSEDGDESRVKRLFRQSRDNVVRNDAEDTLGFKKQALEAQLKLHGTRKNKKGHAIYIPTMSEVRTSRRLGSEKRFSKEVGILEREAARRQENGEDVTERLAAIEQLKANRQALKQRRTQLRAHVEDAEVTARLGVGRHNTEARDLQAEAKAHRKQRSMLYQTR